MSSERMDDLPSFEDAQSLTDWVIDTAAATDINAYTLWLIVRRSADGDEGELEKSDVDPVLLEQYMEEALETDGEYTPEPEPAPEPEPEPTPQPAPEPSPGFDWDELDQDQGEGEFGIPEPSGDVVTQQEYEQFKVEVQGLIQNLIEFLISYDMLSDEPPEEREELIAEFEMLTRNFEEDVSEFFDHLDNLLNQTQVDDTTEEPDEDVVFDADEKVGDLMSQLRSSISEVRDLKEEAADDDQPDEPDLESLLAKLEDSQYESDDDVRQVLGRLNRLLDEVGEYPEHERAPPRREEPRRRPREEERRPPREQYEEVYEEPYEDHYEQEYEEHIEEDWGQAQAPAQAFAGHETRRHESRNQQTEEYDEAGLLGIGLLPIDFAWLGAGITYGGLDMFTTAMVLQAGGQELNPLFDLLGGSLAGFVLWKTFVLFLLFVFFYPDDPVRPQSLQWWVPLIVTAAGIVLTVSNLFVLIG